MSEVVIYLLDSNRMIISVEEIVINIKKLLKKMLANEDLLESSGCTNIHSASKLDDLTPKSDVISF